MADVSSKRTALKDAKRIVIKVGTSTLTYPNGRMKLVNIDRLSRAIADLVNGGKEVLLVSSGAIGVGVGYLNLPERPETIREKQAVAAVGQCALMNAYTRSLSEYAVRCGQILLTKDNIDDKFNRINISNTIEALLEKHIVPIINENDTVSTTEIWHNETFGDNDTLSALVSCLVQADLLIILSDIDGLYTGNPREDESAERISYVEEITDEIRELAAGAGSKLGTGGMHTKINAMELIMKHGINGVIADGSEPQIISEILDFNDVGTFFAGN